MPKIPGRCLNCGHVEPRPPGFFVENSTNIESGGSMSHGACSRCGGPIELLTGRFNVTDGGIEMLSGPEWSWDLVEKLGLALRVAVETKPLDPVAPIRDAVPDVGAVIDTAVEEGLKNGPKKRPAKNRRKLRTQVVERLHQFMVDAAIAKGVEAGAPYVGQGLMEILQWVAEHGSVPFTG